MTSNQPLAVLHVAQPAEAGVPRVAGDYILDQLERGWRVGVAAPEGGELHRRSAGSTVFFRPWKAAREPWKGMGDEGRRLMRIVSEFQPDVVHLHSAKAGLVGRLVVRGRLPTVFQPHAWSFLAVSGPMRRATVAWECGAARWADRILCVSEAERLLGEWRGVPGRWAVVPNGIDLQRHRVAEPAERDRTRRALGLPAGPLVVCVGRLSRQKGQDLLVEAWGHLLQRAPDATLALVGDGPLMARLKSRALPRVIFLGAVQDARTWYAAADVVAVPSRWEAGVPLVALEAMAAGRPVIVTDVAGIGKVVDGSCVTVVPPERPTALAEAVIKDLKDPARAHARGRASRASVEARFDLRPATAEVARLLVDVAKARGASGARPGA